jgi:hypothetical protein
LKKESTDFKSSWLENFSLRKVEIFEIVLKNFFNFHKKKREKTPKCFVFFLKKIIEREKICDKRKN